MVVMFLPKSVFFCPLPRFPLYYKIPRLTPVRCCLGSSAVPSTCPKPKQGSLQQHPEDADGVNSPGFCVRPDPAERCPLGSPVCSPCHLCSSLVSSLGSRWADPRAAALAWGPLGAPTF